MVTGGESSLSSWRLSSSSGRETHFLTEGELSVPLGSAVTISPPEYWALFGNFVPGMGGA